MIAHDSGELTRRDRDRLVELVRKNDRLAKTEIKEHAAKLKADGERQLATMFKAEDERWRDAVAIAEQSVKDANAAIARHCEGAGVPQDMQPSVRLGWLSRGDNASASRRAELRKVLYTRVDALAKQATTEVERRSLATQTELIAGGLDSDAARAMLADLPDAAALMPALDIASFPEVQALTAGGEA